MTTDNERVISENRKYCRHIAKDGRKCILYFKHYGPHKEKHLKSFWSDNE